MAEPGARERLLRDGYLIFRSILPAATLERMRISTAALVEQHKDLHGLQGQHDKGCFAGTMSPYVETNLMVSPPGVLNLVGRSMC